MGGEKNKGEEKEKRNWEKKKKRNRREGEKMGNSWDYLCAVSQVQ